MSRDARIAGTRDAQVAMLSPLARKIAQIAMCQRTSWERERAVSMRITVTNRFDVNRIDSETGRVAGTIAP